MSLNNLTKYLNSIRALGFFTPILLAAVIAIPLYLTGNRAIEELSISLTKELLLNELQNMTEQINNKYERLKLVGLEDSEEHLAAIKTRAMEGFRTYKYRSTGVMFVATREGALILDAGVSNQGPEYEEFKRALHGQQGVITYAKDGKARWGVFMLYEPWQYYLGITLENAELFAHREQFQRINLLMMAISIIIALMFVLTSQHLFIQPLKRLIDYANDIAAGRYSTQLSGRFYLELNDLKCALSKMVVAIVQRMQQIQEQLQIIARREAERDEAIRQAEQEAERLNVTLRSIADAVIAHDLAGNITLFNKAAERMLGIRHEEALGQPISSVLSMLSPVKKQKNTSTTTGNAIEFIGQYELKTRSGEPLQVSCTANLIRDSKSQPIGTVMVIRDITTHTKLLNEMNKAQKLESLGLLAGGIAHDFNNILTSVMSGVSMASKLLEKDSQKALEFLKKAEKALERAVGLTSQLLTFAKGGEPLKQPLSIKEIVMESTEFMLTGSGTRCEYHFQEGLWMADADKNQISQVVQNIVLNARQAMNDSGTIWITCENFEKSESPPIQTNGLVNTTEEWNRLCPFALPKGRYLKLSISDNGPGIPKKLLERIFEPYFTTKEHGNGLGLAISHSIVTKHGGCTVVESEEGKGTAFTIYLPASQATEAPKTAAPTLAQPVKPLKLLIMDDDSMILELAALMLKELGYEVMTAVNGEEALDIYKKSLSSERPVDIVIMDITVKGGMGAKETMPMLLALNPNVKAVVSSGYSKDPIMANYKEYGFAAALPKPYRIQEMTELLEKLAETVSKE